jgi:hypothetical protein
MVANLWSFVPHFDVVVRELRIEFYWLGLILDVPIVVARLKKLQVVNVFAWQHVLRVFVPFFVHLVRARGVRLRDCGPWRHSREWLLLL